MVEVDHKVATTSAPAISTVSLTRKSPISVHRLPAPQHRSSFASTDCVLSSIKQVTHDDVAAAVRALPNKQCASNPIPTWLLKECSSELVPFLYRLLNASLSAGVVLAAFKSAYICPLLKKADLDTADAKNYRPISNLTVLSKLLEKLVAGQLINYLSVYKLLPHRQSAYRAFRSTETAIAGLMSDILL